MDKGFRLRLGLAASLITFFGVGVMVRAGYLMLSDSPRLSRVLERQFREAPPPQPRRGAIVDRNGESLAVSLDSKSLYVHPTKVKNKRWLAKKLSKILKISRRKLLKKLKQKKGFVWIKRHLDRNEELRVLDLLNEDRRLYLVLGLSKGSKRRYPNQHLAAHLIGFTGTDSHGLEGLEYHYEGTLSGKNQNEKKNTEGLTLVLTLDKALQHSVEKELAEGIRKSEAQSGSAIVMDADTGDILAMASWPTYNLNKFRTSKGEERRNRAIAVSYEPGSTLKAVLMGGALEKGLITSKTKFFCENGELLVGNRRIRESNRKHKWGWLTAERILQVSSNIGAIKVARQMGKEELYEWYKRQGFGKRTGVDLPGEAVGSLKNPAAWSEVNFSNIAFGQGLSITPIQLVRAYATIANGGFMVKPRLVLRLENSDGDVHENKPIEMYRVMGTTTAWRLSEMLSLVTQPEGTGARAHIKGFTIAGKTGTAQVAKPGKGYIPDEHIFSFVGFPKGIKPKILALVVINSPDEDFTSGGAAAIFKSIMTAALARAGVRPKIEQEIKLADSNSPNKSVVKKIARRETKTLVYGPPQERMMPDLKGKSARFVLDEFSKKKVKLKIKGSGLVSWQFPRAGTKLKTGQKVSVRLRYSEKSLQ